MPNYDERICIIGGGPAGISAAMYLEKAGYSNYVVYEKLNKIGGKSWSPKVNVNGQERTVYYTEERMKNVPPMSYYVLGNHQPGDQVSIDASAPGYPDIHGLSSHRKAAQHHLRLNPKDRRCFLPEAARSGSGSHLRSP